MSPQLSKREGASFLLLQKTFYIAPVYNQAMEAHRAMVHMLCNLETAYAVLEPLTVVGVEAVL